MISFEFERGGKLLECEFKRFVADIAVLYAYVTALVSGVGLVLLLANMDKLVSWLIFALGIAIYIGAVGGVSLYKYNKYKAESAKGGVNVTAEFGECVTLSAGDSLKTFEYKDFFRVKETEDYVFLYSGKYEFLTLPKESIGDVVAFTSFLKEQGVKS